MRSEFSEIQSELSDLKHSTDSLKSKYAFLLAYLCELNTRYVKAVRGSEELSLQLKLSQDLVSQLEMAVVTQKTQYEKQVSLLTAEVGKVQEDLEVALDEFEEVPSPLRFFYSFFISL